MKNRIYLVIFLALGLMACSKSKTTYVGNTYEGKAGEETTLTYQFLSESEVKFELNSSWSGHHAFVCRYTNVAEKMKEELGEYYDPYLVYMDGCSILMVDSVNYLSKGEGMLSLGAFLSSSGYSDLEELLSGFLYDNEKDEIITLKTMEYYDIFDKFGDAVSKAKEKNEAPKITVTCRPELPYLSGFVCPRKVN